MSSSLSSCSPSRPTGRGRSSVGSATDSRRWSMGEPRDPSPAPRLPAAGRPRGGGMAACRQRGLRRALRGAARPSSGQTPRRSRIRACPHRRLPVVQASRRPRWRGAACGQAGNRPGVHGLPDRLLPGDVAPGGGRPLRPQPRPGASGDRAVGHRSGVDLSFVIGSRATNDVPRWLAFWLIACGEPLGDVRAV